MDEAGQVRNEQLDPEREALRRAALSQIRQYPDPALRIQAREVEQFDDELAQLADRMLRLMADANGVGLAANQVGVVRRVFVFQPDPESEPIVVVNPVIVERGQETAVDEEGCLSMQGVQVPVERATTIRLEGRGVGGEDLSLELSDLGARVAQHELDHLDGVLILERTTEEARKEALGILRPRAMLTPQ
jgi:peptide deformylase